jgi:hypothetical protein
MHRSALRFTLSLIEESLPLNALLKPLKLSLQSVKAFSLFVGKVASLAGRLVR